MVLLYFSVYYEYMTTAEVKTRKIESKLIVGAEMAAIFVPGPSNFLEQEIILAPFKIPNRVSMATKCSKTDRSTPLFLLKI